MDFVCKQNSLCYKFVMNRIGVRYPNSNRTITEEDRSTILSVCTNWTHDMFPNPILTMTLTLTIIGRP